MLNVAKIGDSLLVLIFIISGSLLSSQPSLARSQDLQFQVSTVQGLEPLTQPKNLQFGPDGWLYIAQSDGALAAYHIVRRGTHDFQAIDSELINAIKYISNYNSDGSIAGVSGRRITGLTITGTSTRPIIYVSSADPRPASHDGQENHAAANSGVVSRLTWNGSEWDKVDLVRGLPYSAQSPAGNALQIDDTRNVLYVAATVDDAAVNNPQASVNKLAGATSAAILAIDPAKIDQLSPKTNAQGQAYLYDLPADLAADGLVRIVATGFSNLSDLSITHANTGNRLYAATGAGNTSCAAAQAATLYLVPDHSDAGSSDQPHDNVAADGCADPRAQGQVLAHHQSPVHGLAEYGAAGFGGSLQGHLLGADATGAVYNLALNDAGDAVLAVDQLAALGAAPAAIAAQGERGVFPGTIWIATVAANGSAQVTVLEPAVVAGRDAVSQAGQGSGHSDSAGTTNANAGLRVVQRAQQAGNSAAQARHNKAAAQETGLDFPGSAAVAGTMRFRFAHPERAGLALYGPGGAGVTYVWRAYPRQQAGYYTAFFWGNDDGQNNLNTFLWANGGADSYYGAHPYPNDPPNGNTHRWEIALEQSDFVNGAVVYQRWYTQALRVWADASGKHHEFYWDLPQTDASHRVVHDSPASWGNVNPPAPALTWGDAPWNPGNEVWNGVLRGIQIYASKLSLADLEAELAAPLSTAAGAQSIWYLNLNPTPADIGDKSGKGHHPAWVGSERPALYTGTTTTPPPTVPTVSITASSPNAAEPTTVGAFTVTRSGSTTQALTVNLSAAGTATSGSDYTALASTVSIPVGQASVTMAVTPKDDTLVEGNETVIATVASSSGYTVGTPTSATVTIADNDTTTPPPTTITTATAQINFQPTGASIPSSTLR